MRTVLYTAAIVCFILAVPAVAGFAWAVPVGLALFAATHFV